jgi:hypothetical protein
LREGEHSREAEARGEKLEFTYTRSCFMDQPQELVLLRVGHIMGLVRLWTNFSLCGFI